MWRYEALIILDVPEPQLSSPAKTLETPETNDACARFEPVRFQPARFKQEAAGSRPVALEV